MGLLSLLGENGLLKLIEVSVKCGYAEVSKSYTFFKLINDFKITYPKDKFDSVYIHTLLLMASKQKHKELIKLFDLDESKEAFKEELNHGNVGAFARSLNASLHTNRLIKELKNWSEVPPKDIEDFFDSYRFIIKEVATPVQGEILNNQENINTNISKGFNSIEHMLIQLSAKVELITPPSDETSRLQKEYDRQLNLINKKIDNNLIKQALDHLLNLKEDIWHDANDRIKFKILTNLGICYYKLNEIENASKYLIDAYKFNSESETALSNIVNGYFAIEDLENANQYLKIFLQRYPSSPLAIAASVKLQIGQKSIEEIEMNLPENLKDNYEVLLSLGIASRRENNFEKSIDYLEKAIKIHPEKEFLKEHLLSSILEKYRENFSVLNLHIIDENTKTDLLKALEIVEDLLKKYDKSELENVLSQLLLNKSLILNLLGNFEASIEAIDKGLLLIPNEPNLLKHKALVLATNGKRNKCKEILEKIQDYSEAPDVPSILAEIYHKEGQIEKGINILESFIKNSKADEFVEQAKSILIELLIESNQEVKLKAYNEIANVPKTIYEAISNSKILKHFGSKDEAKKILIQAKNAITEEITVKEKVLLAEELIDNDCIKDAINLFNTIIDKNIYNPFTKRLANLYYTIGEKFESLKILENLREQYGPLKDITPFEISIYQEYGDYEKAKKVSKEFLQSFPNDLKMKIRLAGINLRLEDYQDVDDFLNEDINIWELNFDLFKVYLAQLMARKFREKLFNIVYEYRRKENNSRGHILYMQIMLQFPMTNEECNSPNKISADTAVLLENKRNEKLTLIIENRPKEELLAGEINFDSYEFLILKNKKVGDQISFKSSSIKWKIKSLINKKVFAFHDSQQKCETIYSSESPFYSITTDDFPKFIENLQNKDNSWQKNYDKIKRMYRQREVPLGTIASKFKKNPIILWDEFKTLKNVGIQSSFGTNDEWKDALETLNKSKSICSDITGLLTAFELGIENLIIEHYGKIKITPSTFDHVFELKEENNFFKVIEENNKKNAIDQFKDFVQSVTESCISKTAIELNSKEKEKLDTLLGASFVDTILLSKETDSILLSDDLTFRGFAKGQYNIDGIWTQALLRSLLINKKLDYQEYQEKVILLTTLNYNHTAIDDHTLIIAAKQANYEYDFPLSNCLNPLKGGISSDYSSLMVGFGFLYQLWADQIIPYEKKSNLSFFTFTTLCVGRKIIPTIDKLYYLIEISLTILRTKSSCNFPPRPNGAIIWV